MSGGPSLEPLVPVVAERIVAILEDATEKLSFLDSITPDVLQHRDELSKFIGDEIMKTLTEQKVLEKRYEELIEQRAMMKGMINKNKYKEVQDEIQDISRALRESTNNLVRSLKENPNVSGNLIKVQRDRTEMYNLLLRANQELRDKGTYFTIANKVEEENAIRLRFKQLKIRENILRENVAKLMEDLKEEQKTFQRAEAEQRQAIVQVKDELQILKGSASADSKFKRQESLASVSSKWREYKLKQRTLEDKLVVLEEKLHTETIVHTDTKIFLTAKHTALIKDNAHWDSKYETDIADMDTEINLITSQREALLANLTELRGRKQDEDVADAAKRLAEEEAAAAAKSSKELAKRQRRAARRIQKEMRAFLKRKKDLEAMGGGKKAKGEKKGKGKKK